MTKTEIHTNVTTALELFLKENKVAQAKVDGLMAIIDEHLKPKTSGSTNPPILNEDGSIKEAYCRFHQRYEPIEDMVISKGKSKGYCKAGISIWNRNSKKIKDLQAKSSDALDNDNLELAKKASKEAKELKARLNDPKSFDYENDWKAFNA